MVSTKSSGLIEAPISNFPSLFCTGDFPEVDNLDSGVPRDVISSPEIEGFRWRTRSGIRCLAASASSAALRLLSFAAIARVSINSLMNLRSPSWGSTNYWRTSWKIIWICKFLTQALTCHIMGLQSCHILKIQTTRGKQVLNRHISLCTHFSKDMKHAISAGWFQIICAATFLVIFEACMNIPFIVKLKIL